MQVIDCWTVLLEFIAMLSVIKQMHALIRATAAKLKKLQIGLDAVIGLVSLYLYLAQ